MSRKLLVCLVIAATTFSKAKAQSTNPKDTLNYYRGQIDALDSQIVDLLGKRMSAARAIGIYKMDHQIGVVQSARFDEVLQNAIKHGKGLGLSEEFIRALYNDIHKESIRQQEELKQTYHH
ncbi:MAG: chorismate mutase [Bacteroidetes bacterium]|nr:chorismate mutase [Bacteroidota bacterium]